MFDLSFGEILLVAVAAVVFIGPKDVPVVLRAVTRGLNYLKSLTRELKAAFDELAKESGLEDAKNEFEREVRYIRGDDGKLYESYNIDDLIAPPPPIAVSDKQLEASRTVQKTDA